MTVPADDFWAAAAELGRAVSEHHQVVRTQRRDARNTRRRARYVPAAKRPPKPAAVADEDPPMPDGCYCNSTPAPPCTWCESGAQPISEGVSA